MRVGSICSGIEAASVAAPAGWSFSFFSEIEKFPSAVLAHHYPDVPNLGDFTGIRAADWPDVELICGGPPCQSFSIAGHRAGLSDDRGNLTLSYVEMCHDFQDNGSLRWGLYENVPGILSDKTNAFGCLISGLVGADDPFCPPYGASWPVAGLADGPRARLAWRVLDAQWFGLAQRRRRVFIVIGFAEGCDPAKVLFERHSLSGHTPPCVKARQSAARSAGTRPAGQGDHNDGTGLLQLVRSYWDGAGGSQSTEQTGGGKPVIIDRAAFNQGENALYDPKIDEDDIMPSLVARGPHAVSHSLRGEGFDGSEDGTGRGTPLVTTARMTAIGEYVADDTASTVKARDFKDATDLVAFSAKDYGADATSELCPTLRAGGHDKSHANSGNWPAIAIQDGVHSHKGQNGAGVNTDGSAYTLDTKGHQAVAIQERAVSENPDHGPEGKGFRDDGAAFTIESRTVPQSVAYHYAVRRLTPVECERLQGFPQLQKSVEFNICWDDKSRQIVDAAKKCTTKQVNVCSVEGVKSQPLVKSASPNSNTSHHVKEKHAHVHVLINLEGGTLEVRNALKLIWYANIAEKSEKFLPHTPIDDIVQLAALTVTELARRVQRGRAELPANTSDFLLHLNGRLSADLSGQEIAEYVNDAELLTIKVKECLKSITSQRGLNTQINDSIRTTSFCCVLAAISGFIPKGTLTENTSFKVSIVHGYTAIPWRGKNDSPAGPRYKSLGNSWAVPVVAWIFDRLDQVDRAARGDAG